MTQSTEQERAEFEAWLGIKPCGAAHDLAWSAWKAARRAPAKPQWPQFEQCQDAFDAAKNRYPQGNPLGGDHEWHWFQVGWNGRAPVVPHTKVKADFRWDSENQHHIPTLLIEFEPVPAGEPCDAKGWTDRDNLAAMLAAAHQPTEVASCR